MPIAAVPLWLRRAARDAQSHAGHGLEDIALTAGAAIGALDSVVRRDASWAGAWRQRLALKAAAVTARQMGRSEDEAALRDAVLLTRPGDDVGPAGRMLVAWRRLAARPAAELLTEESLCAAAQAFGHARDGAAIGDLADALRRLCAGGGLAGMPEGAGAAAERCGFGGAFSCWLADALLAQLLGWAHAVPLLGTEAAPGFDRGRRAATGFAAGGVATDAARAKYLLAAQARAALRAIDLFADLGRRADKLRAVAPKLRAKGAEIVVDRLLCGDAMVASEPVGGMSERALRRLFDRLLSLDAVRELSGRPAFRIYGL